MTLSHAVLWIDHHAAQLMPFDGDHAQKQQVREHAHYTRQHGSAVRSEHEFFAEVCERIEGLDEVLVTGAHVAQGDFRHYVEKHRPATLARLVGWETVGHPTQGQLLALARQFFERRSQQLASGPR
jgi:stalled ribosome rescue protein Dom34